MDSFRIATKTDAENIAALVNESYRPEFGVGGWTHESDLVLGARTNPNQIADIISKTDSIVLLGLVRGEIVACVHIEKGGNHCHVGMLAVKPNLQGMGIGTEMLTHAENVANANFGAGTLVLQVVSARTELISFYVRRGYQKTGRVMDYPSADGVGIPKRNDLTVEELEKRLDGGAGTRNFIARHAPSAD